ncbi:MAG TPA: helix-turn-helix domain-containing protein [Chloroflexota bacterium]|nr:helix-turn-helix domain-containing protein [Chloroflexota bacterium]
MSVNPAKPTPLEDKFILTSDEAAEFLGVSLRTIRYWVATRRILTSISDGSSGSSRPT